MRLIMLLDMDHFFVACEEIKRPELKSKPTIVGADPKEGRGRGVVMTCNYPARKYGIHSGMPISAAYKIKPDAIYLPLDYSYYEEKSEEVLSIIKEFSYTVEQVSVDEFFIDVSDKVDGYGESIRYAEKIKSMVKDKAKLPCSIGISSNKLVAKMACEAAKPNGIRLVKGEEAKRFLAKLRVGDLYGVGRKTEEKLGSMGYKTVGDLANANVMDLMDKLGSFGIELHNYANGIDESAVTEDYEVKSISREYTFEYDTKNPEKVTAKIAELSKGVIEEVTAKGFSFKTVTIKMRYSDFTEHLKSRSIRPSSNLEDIISTAVELYKENADKSRKVRKLGVRVSGLADYSSQKKLFN